MKEIIQKENPVLRKRAEEVLLEDIKTDRIQSLIKDMHETLKEKEQGVALAAPQIGSSLRIFIVAERIFEEEVKKEEHLVYINPKIIKTSKKIVELEEGCLSVEGYSGTMTRAQQVTVEAHNEHGVKFVRGASGLLAQIFQHEIDHLNGILYTDHARDIREVETQDIQEVETQDIQEVETQDIQEVETQKETP